MDGRNHQQIGASPGRAYCRSERANGSPQWISVNRRQDSPLRRECVSRKPGAGSWRARFSSHPPPPIAFKSPTTRSNVELLRPRLSVAASPRCGGYVPPSWGGQPWPPERSSSRGCRDDSYASTATSVAAGMSRAEVGARTRSSRGTRDNVIGNKRIAGPSREAADPAGRLLTQHLRTDAAMVSA